MCTEATEVLTSNVMHPSQTIDVDKLEGVAKARYALTLAAEFMYEIMVNPEGWLSDLQVSKLHSRGMVEWPAGKQITLSRVGWVTRG